MDKFQSLKRKLFRSFLRMIGFYLEYVLLTFIGLVYLEHILRSNYTVSVTKTK